MRVAAACALITSAGIASVAQAAPDAAAREAATLPRYDHVVIVMEENESDSRIYGDARAPYLNGLKDGGVYFTQSYAVTHPSQPNYLALFSGATQGVDDDSCPHTFSAADLGSQLRGVGLSFAGYAEGLPQAGASDCHAGKYARKHAPWANFSALPAATNLAYSAFPSDFDKLPTVSFVIPDLCNDMHNCGPAAGDSWLRKNIDAYAQWARTHNSLLIVTWDEDDRSRRDNRIATILYGAHLKNGATAQKITHYSVLRTLEDMYALAPLGGATSATPIADIWDAGAGVAKNASVAASESSAQSAGASP